MLPLDGGGLMLGQGGMRMLDWQAGRKDTAATTSTTASKAKARASKHRASDAQMAEQTKTPERTGTILMLWAVPMAALVAMGYLLAKPRSKTKND